MPNTALDGAWAKLERARRHRQALETDIYDHFRTRANRPLATGQYDTTSGYHVFRITAVPDTLTPFLLKASVVVGDIAHNLRSCLDHLAFQLAMAQARHAGKVLSKAERERIYFPIHSRGRKLRRGAAAGWLDRESFYVGLFGLPAASIIKSRQPYRGRAGRAGSFDGRYRHQLALLRELSNRDKHRIPNVVAAFPTGLGFRFPPGVGLERPTIDRTPGASRRAWEEAERLWKLISPSVRLGATAAHLRLTGARVAQTTVEAEVTPQLTLSNGGSITMQVERIADYIEAIVRDCEQLSTH